MENSQIRTGFTRPIESNIYCTLSVLHQSHLTSIILFRRRSWDMRSMHEFTWNVRLLINAQVTSVIPWNSWAPNAIFITLRVRVWRQWSAPAISPHVSNITARSIWLNQGLNEREHRVPITWTFIENISWNAYKSTNEMVPTAKKSLF